MLLEFSHFSLGKLPVPQFTDTRHSNNHYEQALSSPLYTENAKAAGVEYPLPCLQV